MDNGKLLSATGLRQQDLMPVKDALVLELSRLPQGDPFAESRVSKAMTEWLLQSRHHKDQEAPASEITEANGSE